MTTRAAHAMPTQTVRQGRSSVGTQGGEHAAPGDEQEPGHAMPSLVLDRLAAVASGAGQRITLGLELKIAARSLAIYM